MTMNITRITPAPVTLAIDPSISACGVALFEDERLTHAATIEHDTTKDSIGARCASMGQLVLGWLARVRAPQPERVVAEWPRIRRESGKTRNDRNDLPGLAGVASYIAGALAVSASISGGSCEFVSYFPGDWTAQVSKSLLVGERFTNARALRIASRLDSEELLVYQGVPTHDAIDAIGIGLHDLGRGIMHRHRVFHGAS